MIRPTAKPKIAIAVIISVLTLSLPFYNLPQAQASGKSSRQKDLRQLAPEPQLLEQRDSTGEVLARLHISPGDLPSTFRFQVEDLRTYAKGDGTVEIGSGAIKVRFMDLASKTRVGIDIRPDQETPHRIRIGLRHNKNRCELAIDGERSKSVATQIRDLSDQGKQAEARRLIPAIGDTFSGRDEYIKFARRVAKSPALGILTAAVSVKESVSSEESHRNLPLHAIGLAANLLAPSSMKKATQHHSPSKTTQAQQPRLIKASYNAGTFNSIASLTAPQGDCGCCYNCSNITAILIVSCLVGFAYCIASIDPYDEFAAYWEALCYSFLAGCIVSAFFFDYWCKHEYCGTTEDGIPFCDLGLC